MANRWYSRMIATGELSSVLTSQKFKLNGNKRLKAVRTWIMIYNSPTLTGLTMHIYSNNAGAPGKLLHSSTNDWDKADISTSAYACREIYFEFDEVPLVGSDFYHIVLKATVYTGTDSSHIGWALRFPDITYDAGLTKQTKNIATWPVALSFIGADA